MAVEEMERMLVSLADLQQENHALLGKTLKTVDKLGELVLSFAETQNTSLLRLETSVTKLTAQVDAFIRGARHNGGKKKS